MAPQEQSLGVSLVGADVLRAVAVLSLVVGALGWGVVGAALFLLVLGGTFLPRAVGAPPALDVASCAAFLVGAWTALLGGYEAVGALDLGVHVAATGLAAGLGLTTLERLGVLSADLPAIGRGVSAVTLGATLALLWEVGEWAGSTWLDSSIRVGYADTVGDLAAGLLGAVIAGAAYVVASRPSRPSRDPMGAAQ